MPEIFSSSDDQIMIQALAAVQRNSLNTGQPGIVDALWGYVESVEWEHQYSPLQVCFSTVRNRAQASGLENRAPTAKFVRSKPTGGYIDRIVAEVLTYLAQTKLSRDELSELSRATAHEWLLQISSTEPCNHQAAEEGLKKLYEAAGCSPPEVVLWFDNPRAASIAGALFARITIPKYFRVVYSGRSFSRVVGYLDEISRQIGLFPSLSENCKDWWDSRMRNDRSRAGFAPDDFPWSGNGLSSAETGWRRDLWDVIESCALEQDIGAEEIARVGKQVSRAVSSASHGKLFYNSQCREQIEFVRTCFGVLLDRQRLKTAGYRSMLNKLGVCPHKDDGLEEILKNCGGFIPFENLVIAVERPIAIKRDGRNRLHNSSGKSIEYGDGWGAYMLSDVRVPERLVRSPGYITVEEILQNRNSEIRSLMIEIYGMERFLSDSNAELVSEDAYGSLYYKGIGHHAEHAIVKVVNRTAEPDGVFKEYFLEVPSGMRTAREAVAWTFFMDAREYEPAIET